MFGLKAKEVSGFGVGDTSNKHQLCHPWAQRAACQHLGSGWVSQRPSGEPEGHGPERPVCTSVPQ